MTESAFIQHEPCPSCGSSDALARYTDGHGHCFSCNHHEAGNGATTTRSPKVLDKNFQPIAGDFQSLIKRGISEDTCRHFGYIVGVNLAGKKVQAAPYYKDGVLVGQKTRTADKEFSFIGSPKNVELFGQHLWRDGGKKVVITEGEIDAMTVSQLQGNKWPVVSLPNGASGAAKSIKNNIEWLEKFEEVVLMFDNDEPGLAAVEDCAPLFTPGRCKVARLPMKDANEMLLAGKGGQVIEAMWSAKAYRPDGLVGIADLSEELNRDIEQGLPWFLDSLTKLTFGRRLGELYGLGAGTGIGKTDVFTQQIAFDIHDLGERVGLVFLEQQPAETVTRVAGKLARKRFHVPDGSWTREERNEWVAKLDGKVTLYNSWGQTEWSVVAQKIRYMAVAEGIRIFYIDHLTAMADTADERGSLEQIMKEMAGLANGLKVIIHYISHLATPEGKSHEEGGHVSIRHFKGARAIGFWSHFMFGLERNQQADTEREQQATTLRCLKDRYTGQATGKTIALAYDAATGMLSETDEFSPFEDRSAPSQEF